VSFAAITLFCCFSTIVHCCKRIFRYRLSPENFAYILVDRWVDGWVGK